MPSRRSYSCLPPLTTAVVCAWLLAAGATPAAAADREFPVRGMVLDVSPERKALVVSHDDIPGFMSSMTMPFDVRDAAELAGLAPGSLVSFTLVVGDAQAYATRFVSRGYEPASRDPRLRTPAAASAGRPGGVAVGAAVPGFTLTTHQGQPVSLASLAGKVVVLNFVYTSCTVAEFCPRIVQHLTGLQRRFEAELGRDLVLLTVTIDPVRDTPAALAAYAARVKATSPWWWFLTGTEADVRRVGRTFGVEVWPGPGQPVHTVRTVVVDRAGRLAARVDGNQFDAQQMGDLVLAVLNAPR